MFVDSSHALHTPPFRGLRSGQEDFLMFLKKSYNTVKNSEILLESKTAVFNVNMC